MNIPIVTLDKLFIKPDEKNIYFIDCTRINGSDKVVARQGESLDLQIKRLVGSLNSKEVILADDVVFSGSVLRNIIKRLNNSGISVVGIISSICTIDALNYFKNNLKYGIRTNYILESSVIDQICERDFYFGIAGSGIMIDTNKGLYKAPYFEPYGNPYERASIPIEYVNMFSKGCLERSIYLWEKIEKLKKSVIFMRELPEKIINTESNQEVVKTLKKELKKL